MAMHPRPSADTSGPVLPSRRSCMRVSYAVLVGAASLQPAAALA